MSETFSPDLARQAGSIAPRINRPVVLVGLMGVGKSTIGRRLANLLRRDFVDVDEEIEHAAARTISEIFEEHGEPYFRDGERRVIKRLMDEDHGVIATGGGAFVDPQTRALILEQGIAVWLDCEIETLVKRTARRDSRPLLRNGDPKQILSDLKAKRAPAYAEAPLHILTDDTPHEATVARIIERLEAWL
ncbi:shikimate kinase [Erythrobacter litoralis]|uniref:shikimate kinase n=1 Tax=Erythrobacter litoralis TaxID=39960 RepID=UPI0024349170|nr:shikimate kinase [Erythrobacter litoralis]MDG6080212.1 shikimate kinase [Erythrobacter litoralis]